MIFGMTALTFIHVVISLIGIFSGLFLVYGFIAGKSLDHITALFLSTTTATSITGYFFPFHAVTPGMVIGAISLIALAVAVYARYSRHLERGWRTTYVVSSVLALYLNVFVLVVQLFEKVPSLRSLAPTQSETPFKIAQLVVMALFIALGYFSVKGFREHPIRVANQPARRAA
jgi:hypothetical protein